MRTLLEALAEPGACLTIDRLPEALEKSYKEACSDLRRAYAAGYIERVTEGCYRLTDRGRSGPWDFEGLEPAVLPRKGGTREDTIRDRIWAAMRQLGKFCRADLMSVVAAPGQDPAKLARSVKRQLSELLGSGYLALLPGRVKVAAQPNGGQKRYRLIRDTGPASPLVRRDGSVFDRNLGRTVTPDVKAG